MEILKVTGHPRGGGGGSGTVGKNKWFKALSLKKNVGRRSDGETKGMRDRCSLSNICLSFI